MRYVKNRYPQGVVTELLAKWEINSYKMVS